MSVRPLNFQRPTDIKYRHFASRSIGFAEPFRNKIEALANHAPWLNDLANSFPGMLFALATDFGTLENRQKTYNLLKHGGSLKLAAKMLDLPWWLRKLPPQTFQSALPNSLPDNDFFSKHIVNLIPRHHDDIATWFRKVIKASQLCNENFALWVANTAPLYAHSNEVGESDATLELLAAWAWYSQHKEVPSHYLIQTLWHPNIGLHKALDASKIWYNRTKLVLFIGDKGIDDCWLDGKKINGYDIVPLRTADDFLTEASMMGNCLDQYADQIRFQRVRVFSIRRDGVPIANIEIGPHEDDRTVPSIEQIRGPKNRRVSPMIWQLAYFWLGQQNFSSRPNGPNWPPVSSAVTQHRIWAPYRYMVESKGFNTSSLSIFNLDQTEKLLLQLEGLALIDSV